ncbi:MAG: hypothetical protein ACQEQ4_10390 [Fibrobacterota bacterium]
MGEIKNLYSVKISEIPHATLVLADAFKRDPLFEALLGDAEKNVHDYTLIAEAMITFCHTYGGVYASSEKLKELWPLLTMNMPI